MSTARALTEYVVRWREASFVPGAADCAQFVRGWVLERTGRDPGAGYAYDTLADGVRALRASGHRDHVALVASELLEVPPALARPGDVAVVPTEDGDALALVAGEVVYALGRAGVRVLPRGAMTRAFACRV